MRKAHTHSALCIILLFSRACMARHRRMSTQFRIRLFSTTRYGNGIRRVSVRMYEPTQLYNQLSSRQYRFLPRTTLFNFDRVFPRSYIFFNDVRDFFPAVIVYYVYKCPNLETFFFFLRGKRVSISICVILPTGLLYIIGHESSTRRSKSRARRFCVYIKEKIYIIPLVIMVIIIGIRKLLWCVTFYNIYRYSCTYIITK